MQEHGTYAFRVASRATSCFPLVSEFNFIFLLGHKTTTTTTPATPARSSVAIVVSKDSRFCEPCADSLLSVGGC